MLETARSAQRTGVDIVIGPVSACGDSAHPPILMVDTRVSPSPEMHRNAPAVFNYESWATIEDVVASGVDVWAAADATGFSSWISLGIGVRRRPAAFRCSRLHIHFCVSRRRTCP
jgi:hypothetical protein